MTPRSRSIQDHSSSCAGAQPEDHHARQVWRAPCRPQELPPRSATSAASRTAAFAVLTVSIDVTIGLLSPVPVQAWCSTSAGADFPHHLVLASNLRRIYSVAPPAAAGGFAQDDRHVELTSGQAPERFYLSGVPSRVPTRSGQRRPSDGPRAAMFGLPFPIRRD